jgi:membrane-associated phospholipid phosphatase
MQAGPTDSGPVQAGPTGPTGSTGSTDSGLVQAGSTDSGPVQAVDRFDSWADARLEGLRGNRAAVHLFQSASHLGDHSLIWLIVAAARGTLSERNARQAPALAVLIGAESLLVNQGIKRLFRRTRPTETGDPRFPVRRPSTSSFPSGHASSAFFAASVLTEMSGRRSAPMWFAAGAVVAASRAFVRIHHASDVVGGVVVGLALGQLAVRAVRARH